jgi:hypothetical protein
MKAMATGAVNNAVSYLFCFLGVKLETCFHAHLRLQCNMRCGARDAVGTSRF